ncbi:MAG: twin-arginine translocation signal domain-containing protein, partial [Planctomycetota bacterium]
MNAQTNSQKPSTSRRQFLKQTSGALAGAALASAISTRAYAAEQNTIKIALI